MEELENDHPCKLRSNQGGHRYQGCERGWNVGASRGNDNGYRCDNWIHRGAARTDDGPVGHPGSDRNGATGAQLEDPS